MATIFGLEFKDLAIVVATLLGPILAVQAQKMIERFRDRRGRKSFVFEQLMATRAARIAPDHVRALNMIDLVFYGRRLLGRPLRTRKEQDVLDAWKEYLDELKQPFVLDQAAAQSSRRNELFLNLLFAMAKDVGFSFDRVQLKRDAYSPVAHGEWEAESAELRAAALKVFSGKIPLSVAMAPAPQQNQEQPG